MWSPGPDRTVTCIACGRELVRSAAREYDKFGDRWDRDGKSFEYLCKPCFRDLTKTPRRDLESRLTEAGAGRCDDRTFISRYYERVATGERDCE